MSFHLPSYIFASQSQRNPPLASTFLDCCVVQGMRIPNLRGPVKAWSSVQAIAADERVIVKQKNGKTIDGGMIEANETNLSISRNKQVVNISRGDIREIYQIKGKAAKAKWAAIGAGVGAGAGTGIGAVKYSPNRDDSEIWIAMGLLLGTGVGAVTGALIGASKRSRTLVYAAP